MRFVLVLLLACERPAAAPVDEASLVSALQQVADVVELTSHESGVRWFLLGFEQPVDHTDPSAGTFKQRALLRHVGVAQPMVMKTSGYFINPFDLRVHELTSLFASNQLLIEHRYFGTSVPEAIDWSTLTINQAANDHHRIVSSLKGVYPAAWVSTGASKDGLTALIHRRFFPGDVAATVAYVAPFSESRTDPRYGAFLERVGESACRERLIALQRAWLERRQELASEVKAKAEGSFMRIPFDRCYEFAAIEARFVFWQYHSPAECDALPDAAAPASVLSASFLSLADPAGTCGDEAFAAYEPYYYQSHAQLGYPAPIELHLGDLLHEPGADTIDAYTPVQVAFDAHAMADVRDWLATAERVILIYGEFDPWTAGAATVDARADAFLFIAPLANHFATLAQLTEQDRGSAVSALRRWVQ